MRRRFALSHTLKTLSILGLIAGVATFIVGCGRPFEKGFPSYISAPNNTVRVSQTLQIATETLMTGSPVTFWVNGVLGGNADGRNDRQQRGVYRAGRHSNA